VDKSSTNDKDDDDYYNFMTDLVNAPDGDEDDNDRTLTAEVEQLSPIKTQ
jgi:hypothetical protein